MKLNKYIIGIGILLLGLLYRFLPNVPNFSPITAIFLFSGAVLIKNKWNILLVIGLLYFSDFLLNNTILRSFYPSNEGLVWYSNYMLFTLISYIGIYFIGKLLVKRNKVFTILIGSILASVLFFIITNMGAWVFDPFNLYPNNLIGLMSAWVAGIPFLQSSLIADLCFTGIMFGTYTLAVKTFKLSPISSK